VNSALVAIRFYSSIPLPHIEHPVEIYLDLEKVVKSVPIKCCWTLGQEEEEERYTRYRLECSCGLPLIEMISG